MNAIRKRKKDQGTNFTTKFASGLEHNSCPSSHTLANTFTHFSMPIPYRCPHNLPK